MQLNFYVQLGFSMYNKEKDIEKYAVAKEFPIIPCNFMWFST